MKATYKDFIGIYDDLFLEDESRFILNEVEKAFVMNPTMSGSDQFGTELGRLDFSLSGDQSTPEAAEIIKARLHQSIIDYSNKFFAIKSINNVASLEVKLQKTPPFGGYHAWHFEADNLDRACRVLAWLVYLNDVGENEGETEFLYQGLRVSPKAGRCVVWPAFFTHTHRGNPVYSQDKYVATGWYVMT